MTDVLYSVTKLYPLLKCLNNQRVEKTVAHVTGFNHLLFPSFTSRLQLFIGHSTGFMAESLEKSPTGLLSNKGL